MNLRYKQMFIISSGCKVGGDTGLVWLTGNKKDNGVGHIQAMWPQLISGIQGDQTKWEVKTVQKLIGRATKYTGSMPHVRGITTFCVKSRK